MRHHQRLRAVAVEGQQLVQAQAGENPGAHQQDQVGAGHHGSHGGQGDEQGQYIATLAGLAFQVAPRVLDDHPGQQADQAEHGQPQAVVVLAVQRRLQPGTQYQNQAQAAGDARRPPESAQQRRRQQRQGEEPGHPLSQGEGQAEHEAISMGARWR